MKKVVLFLAIFLGCFLLSSLSVEASTAKFYEAEYIPNVYVVRQEGNKKYYQQGRVFRNVATNEVAYCLQPFALFDKDAIYESQDILSSIDPEKLQKVKEVVSLGYPYIYTSMEYYMATQMRIWQIMEPDCQFYYTEGLNGPKTVAQDHWFSTLNNMINAYAKAPDFHGKTFEVTNGEQISVNYPFATIFDTTIETELPYSREGNTVTFGNLQPGNYTVKVHRSYHSVSQEPVLFYYHQQSQLLINRGNPDKQVYAFQIKVVPTSITVEKIDKDTKKKKSQGEAKLEGAIFSLYNQQRKKIATITFDKSLKATLSMQAGTVSSLPYGTYFLKEEKAGVGYLCNKEEIKVTLDKEHPDVSIALENQVIQNKVSIKKLYGNKQKMQSEAGVIFEIYDKDNNLYKTVQTDEEGTVQFLLPYGSYRIHQKTGKDEYQKVTDFEVIVKEIEKEHHFTLYDEEIPRIEIDVPNTRTCDVLYPIFLVGILLGGIYVQKKIIL